MRKCQKIIQKSCTERTEIHLGCHANSVNGRETTKNITWSLS